MIIFPCGMHDVGIENGKHTLAHIINDDGKDSDNSKGALCIFYVSKEGWFCKDLILFRFLGNGLIVFCLATNVLTSPRHTPTHPSCKSILIRCCNPHQSPIPSPLGGLQFQPKIQQEWFILPPPQNKMEPRLPLVHILISHHLIVACEELGHECQVAPTPSFSSCVIIYRKSICW